MLFSETKLPGVFKVSLDPRRDERGYFARTWCKKEFADHGLSSEIMQCSMSFNTQKGTLRGMHYQASPYSEVKLVRCTRGAIYDVIVDLRSDLPSFKHWVGCELTSDNGQMLYVPQGCAHGFLTLADESDVFYQMSESYYSEAAAGVRWNDPAFGIAWPTEVQVISDRDRNYPDFDRKQWM